MMTPHKAETIASLGFAVLFTAAVGLFTYKGATGQFNQSVSPFAGNSAAIDPSDPTVYQQIVDRAYKYG
ncbi:MAG: hypothetical protein AAF244_02610 [Pseudomonadota bacterium]